MTDDFKVKIITEADTSGAKETQKELDKIVEASEHAGKEASQNVEKLEESLKDSAQAAEQAQEHIEDVADAAKELAQASAQAAANTAQSSEKIEDGMEKVAQAAESAKGGMEKVAAAANKTKASAGEAGGSLKEMGEAGEKSEYGFRSTTELVESLALLLKGDFAKAGTQAGGAIEAMSVALAGGPWGIAAVALGGLATVIGLIATNSDDAEEKGKDLSESLDKLSPKARGIAGQLLAIAKAAKEQSEKLGEAKTPAEKLAAAFKKAADEAERYMKVRDAMASQSAALAIADTNLAEAQGKITTEQAETMRNRVEYSEKMRKADNAVVAAGYEKNRALEQLHKADREKQAADANEYKAGKEFEARGGQFPISPEVMAEQIRKADQAIKDVEAEHAPPGDETGEGTAAYEEDRAQRIARLTEERDKLQSLAEAYAKLTEAQQKAGEAEDTRKKAQEGANAAIDKANSVIQEQQTQRTVGEKEAATKAQEAANESGRQKKDFNLQ